MWREKRKEVQTTRDTAQERDRERNLLKLEIPRSFFLALRYTLSANL